MREILFRGKRVDNGEWVEGSLVVLKGECFIFIETKPSKVKSLSFKTHKLVVECVEVIPETVGQFTGLCDKNGKKIFEGDVCQVLVKESNEKRIFEVCYGTFCDANFDEDDLFLGFFIKGKLDNDMITVTILQEQVIENCEIIGNVHDNKELMEIEE